MSPFPYLRAVLSGLKLRSAVLRANADVRHIELAGAFFNIFLLHLPSPSSLE